MRDGLKKVSVMRDRYPPPPSFDAKESFATLWGKKSSVTTPFAVIQLYFVISYSFTSLYTCSEIETTI